jgi:hypothetical protein
MTKRIEQSLIRLLVWNALAGAFLGCVFAGFLLYMDVGGLGTMLARAENPLPALFLLFGSFAVTFGSAVCGTAIMALPKNDRDDGPGGGHREDERELKLALIPIPVRVRRK